MKMAGQTPPLGYGKIEGELLKLGYTVSTSTIQSILRRHSILPAPDRNHSSWRTFLNHYKDQMLACDFFTVETLMLRTIYVFFFIELGTRRVHIAGCTRNPDSAWVTQQARNFAWDLPDREQPARYLIRDRDSKFTDSFDSVFDSEGCEIVLTPPKSPQANSIAERWIKSVRTECLDHILIFNCIHERRRLESFDHVYMVRCVSPHTCRRKHSSGIRNSFASCLGDRVSYH